MLRQHMFSRFVCSIKNNPFDFIYVLFYAGILATLAMVLVNPDEALKVFIFSTALSLPLIGKNIKHVCSNKQNLVLPVMLLLFGLLQIIWVEVFKQSGSAFTGAYRSYQNGGKVMIFAALVMTALTTREPCANKTRITSLWTILTAVGLYLFAGYQISGVDYLFRYRVALGFEHQTGTAYALTLIALLASQAIINLRLKHTVSLYLLHFLISLAVIITTQTRAAILVYPLLSIGLFFMHFRHNRTILLKALLAFLILAGLAAVPLKSVIENRYQSFLTDLHSYTQDNSVNSIGARLAMQQVGISTGKAHLLGQSLEQRGEEIQRLVEQDLQLRGALEFINVHLHNEVIDTFSLKGIPGVVVLLLLYIAMFLTAYWQRSPLLFVISGAIAIYGLSDLLLYAKGEALSSVLALCIAAVLNSNPTRESCYD
ncbi:MULTISPECIES: O-antigen ligase family protein [Citrobacter]|uniref:O-antigen ligase family protein n=1 Tax=Citrobacter TaxID=544 RepID=UPI0015E93D76|nr:MULTISPECIES: O-antigen ligase family protein [Citrobacter]ELJ2051180.1 O-antigen ligase family protein [Citrobacter freundii]ELK7393694.1 O-antigen ligase family protein [Citrobacter freundii]MDM3068016.1 O-antigen ligase family protein [Citrobacter sp. Cf224]MEB7951354.1 O-antigen ligase family protein [Citrobacter freundii]QMN56581.1 O-antigen ligase family protein [Citrobacter freundii]